MDTATAIHNNIWQRGITTPESTRLVRFPGCLSYWFSPAKYLSSFPSLIIRTSSQCYLSGPKVLKKTSRNNSFGKRHFYVIKKHNARTGEDKLFSSVNGLLYVVIGNFIYLVAFHNSLKIGLRKMTFCS